MSRPGLLYRWHGNVRQLKNCLETAFAFPEERITAENITIIDIGAERQTVLIPDEGIDLDKEIIPKYYEAALENAGGNPIPVFFHNKTSLFATTLMVSV